jgi:hypothetical protein
VHLRVQERGACRGSVKEVAVFGAGCPRRPNLVASFQFQTSCRSTGQRPANRCRRAIRSVSYVEPRSSIKCLVSRATVSGFCPRLLPAPAGPLPLRRNLVPRKCHSCNCAAAPESASSGCLFRRRPFVQGRTEQEVAGTMRSAHSSFSRLWGLSYNKSLLRAGTHKVLARGRAPSLSGRALCARALLRRRRAAAELSR